MKYSIIPMLAAAALPASLYAEDYPFPLPDSVSAEITINTSQQEKFNNKLLATNIFDFTTSVEQDLIKTFDPQTIRFPHGLWANWYDWRGDYTRQFGDDSVTFTNSLGNTITRQLDHLSSIKIFEGIKKKIGIDGVTELNNQRLTQQGQGYDMLWTFNMSADGENDSTLDNGSPETIARYKDLLSRGLEVKDIELGNENFYPGQRSSIIPGVDDYIARAKMMSKDLKALNPNLQLSVPMLRKANTANPKYNELVAADSAYFDAVTVHTYVGYDPDNADDSDEAYGTALVARAHIAKSVDDYSKKVAPNKPVWLTEWGVKSGGPNAASALGMADTYMFMSENQDTYHRSNWFSVNGKLNSFVQWETYIAPSGVERPRIKYPLEKTLFGSTHQIVRQALQDSVMLASSVNSPELSLGVKSITARAVIKNGKVQLLVINKTNQAAPFTIKADDATYTGTYSHQTMAFDSLSEEKLLAIDAEPLTTLAETSGAVTLPKYSINIITLSDLQVSEDILEVALDTATQAYVYQKNENMTFVAKPESTKTAIQSVTFQVEGQSPVVDASAPYEFSWAATQGGRHAITATVTDTSARTVSSNTLYVNVEGEDQVVTAQLATPSSTSLTLGESVTLEASASVNTGSITKVELFIDNALVKTFTEAPYSYDWTPSKAKSSSIYIKVTGDAAATAISDTIQMLVNPRPQVVTVQITSLSSTNITLGESVTLEANASVNTGTITKVELFIDNTLIKTFTEAPYNYVWTPTQVKSSSVYIKATSDDSTTKTSAIVQVVVAPAQDETDKETGTTPSSKSGGSLAYFWLILLPSLWLKKFTRAFLSLS
ncbi:Ig-like domain-containing protein [Catenovulum maritimum]|uniref:Uncharacterized protein n=1 Tax=Catenovulum maritimum TaxID=1513271 RepID=A0A0J8GPX3_9ALTE|nr:Ig-like domain-containing protein [Catenovulum maritimum]KMT64817.1 hypothetical protein XM47_12265 [Catenovulum maritimum]